MAVLRGDGVAVVVGAVSNCGGVVDGNVVVVFFRVFVICCGY